ncbi:hypothetical protein CFC21_065732 [Triticum aestivum]|uniref:F-box associated beta-propeller type 3 domain-containing protein n=3 Tax=Triticum TaxID=4564 RepID=A0A9R0TSD0_TRITD|nr:hypothetical protein CFC21_065732 [Triticum aestivum]VAI17574.1 unnamed protein product [Triticum turgidum subsp. durum]
MGMEVFTVGEASTSWRETTVDLSYPVVEWITGKFVNGGLFWPIDSYHLEHDPNGIVRFSLEDETFSVIRLPDMLSLNRMLDESFLLDEMQGEICLTGFTKTTTEVAVWMLVEDHTVDSRWEHRYSLYISDLVQPMSLLPGGAIMLQVGPIFYRYELQAPNQNLTNMCELEGLRYKGRRRRTTKQNIFFFNVIPYMESLVRIVA